MLTAPSLNTRTAALTRLHKTLHALLCSLQVAKKLTVKDEGRPVKWLNEVRDMLHVA